MRGTKIFDFVSARALTDQLVHAAGARLTETEDVVRRADVPLPERPRDGVVTR